MQMCDKGTGVHPVMAIMQMCKKGIGAHPGIGFKVGLWFLTASKLAYPCEMAMHKQHTHKPGRHVISSDPIDPTPSGGVANGSMIFLKS